MSIINNYLALDIILTWQGRNSGPREQQQNWFCCESAQLCSSHHKLHLLWPGLDLSPVSLAFHPSCHSSQLYDQHGSSHQRWCVRSGAASTGLGHEVAVWTCSTSSLPIFSSDCSNLSISFLHVKRRRSLKLKKGYIGVNDQAYLWPAVIEIWINKKCRNNKSYLRMKIELGLGCIHSVHRLVQFWCVVVGKPLGCQLSYSLENLEWETVIKLDYLFVQHFQSLRWQALNSCTHFPVVY